MQQRLQGFHSLSLHYHFEHSLVPYPDIVLLDLKIAGYECNRHQYYYRIDQLCKQKQGLYESLPQDPAKHIGRDTVKNRYNIYLEFLQVPVSSLYHDYSQDCDQSHVQKYSNQSHNCTERC